MAKRGRKSSTPAHYAERRGVAAGTGRAQGVGLPGITVFDEGAALLAARARRAIQGRKAEQDNFERDVALEYFG